MRVVKRYHLVKGATYGIARDFMRKLWAFSASTLIVMGSVGGALPAIMGDNVFATSSVQNIVVSPDSLDINGSETKTSQADTSGYDNLKLSFDFKAGNLEAGDSLEYGWKLGASGTENLLGTIAGVTGNPGAGEEGSKTDIAITDSLATASNFILYFKNTGTSTGVNDQVKITNLKVSGNTVTPSSVTAGVGGDYATLQEAIDNVASGGTINIISNLTTTSQVTVNKPVTINGGGHTTNPAFAMVDTSNNSVIGVQADNVTISNLIVDGAGGTSLHGINVYMATGINLDNVTLKNNDKSGLNINGSTVVVNNISTSGNSSIYGAINVDQADGVTKPARLTVDGTSSQAESLAIKIDDINKDVDVVINNSQYQSQVIGKYKIYNIKQAPEVLPPVVPQAPQNLVFSRSNTNVNQGKMLNGSITKVKPTNTGLDFVWTHWDKQPGVVYQIDTFYERNDGTWERIHHSDAVNGKTNPYRFYGFGSKGEGRYKTTVYVWDMVAKKRVSPASATLSYDSTPAKVKTVNLNQIKPIDGVDYTSAKLNSGFLDVTFTTDEPLKSGAVGFRIPGFAGPPATGWTYVTPTGNTNEYLAHMSLLDRTDKSVYANWKNFFVGKTYENINLYFHLTDKAGNTKNTYYALDSAGNPIDGWTTNVNDSRNYKFTLDNTEPAANLEFTKSTSVSTGYPDSVFGSMPYIPGAFARNNVMVKGSATDDFGVIKKHWFEVTAPDGHLYYWYNFNSSISDARFNITEAKDNNGIKLPLDQYKRVKPGIYQVRYVATDQVGNRSDENGSLVKSILFNYTGPSIDFTDDTTTGATAGDIKIGYSVTGSNLSAVYLALYNDENHKVDEQRVSGITTGSANGIATFDKNLLVDGKYRLEIRASNYDGTWGSKTDKFVVLDRTAPIAEIISPATNSLVQTANGMEIKLKAVDDGIGMKRFDVTVWEKGDPRAPGTSPLASWGSLVPASDTKDWTTSFKLANNLNLPDGEYTIYFTATDLLGRYGNATSVHFKVDSTAPNIKVNPIADVNVGSQPIVSGTTDDPNSDVVVTPVGGSPQVINHEDFTDNGDGTYGWSVMLSVATAPGSSQVGVESTDAAGNSAVDSITATSPIKVSFNVINPSDNGGNNNGGNNNGGSNNTGNPSGPSGPGNTTNPQATGGVAGVATFAAPIAVAAPLAAGAGAPAVAVATPGVLGTTTDQNKTPKVASNFADQGKVLGDTTAKSDSSKTCTKFLGICWYYWIPVVLIIVAIIWWWKYRHDAKAHNTSSRS